jgi:hydrogenase-4 component F
MAGLVVGVALVPLVSVLAALLLRPRIAAWSAVATSAVTLCLVVVLLPHVANGSVVGTAIFRLDALSSVFLLATAFLYLTTALYTVGYLRSDFADPAAGGYLKRLLFGLNVFAWSLLMAPIVDGLALLWIAIEVTTVVSALLVALDDTDDATEAAWKYIVLASIGLGVALLATIFMYAAGSARLGTSYDLEFGPLLAHAAALPRTPVLLAFCLAVVGFGTKVGLVPMHTWLPDAHAEAPTPASALLSGSLLVVSFYAVLRYYQVATGTLGTLIPQKIMLVFGVLTLLLAALYLLEQHNLKRMLAYSSIEHMGILAVGVSFGAPVALAGVLLHILAHAAAKSGAFMGAGVLVQKFQTKQVTEIRNARAVLPWSAPLLLLGVLILSALPPFGIFRSEFQIVAGGLQSGRNTAAGVLVVLVTVAFFGLAGATTRMVAGSRHGGGAALHGVEGALVRGEPSRLMVAAVLMGVLALLVLGVHPPHLLVQLLETGAAQLAGGAA